MFYPVQDLNMVVGTNFNALFYIVFINKQPPQKTSHGYFFHIFDEEDRESSCNLKIREG